LGSGTEKAKEKWGKEEEIGGGQLCHFAGPFIQLLLLLLPRILI